jgi:hypothetical protein
MTTVNLSQEEIKQLRSRRDQLKASYGARNQLFTRYEEIYFMKNIEKPKDAGVDPKDWKVTASPGGRDKVTGLKRILDTSEIHIKVKDGKEDAQHSDKIEAALKTMLRVSGEYKAARNERDTNLAAILYGPVVMTVNSVDDLIISKTKDYTGADRQVNKFIIKQLETIRKRTPFLIDTINPKESYPEWGKYGLSGHLQEYTLKGMEIKEEWGCDPTRFKDDTDYIVSDFFHYDKRLVESGGTTLFAGEWLSKNADGDIEGVTNIPVFARYAGGSTLFHKPEEQLQSFLYAYAKGEWDKRENLFWTYLFTAIYTQGLPGPTILRDPDDTSDITVDYRGGVKIITAKGKLENVQVIDGDVIQIKNLMDEQTGKSTIQEQTIGGTSGAATFSSYVMEVNAGKLPAIDPTEAQEQCYRDLFLHILQRIKSEGIVNDLIEPEDIPADVELEVTLEPDLQQDDLRNSQIVTQLKGSGANVSDEWLNTNLLKIADSNAMFRQKTKEDIRKAIVGSILQNPQLMQQFIAAAMGQGQQQPPAAPPDQTMPTGGEQPPPGYHQMPDGSMMSDAEMQGQGGQPQGMTPGMGAEAMPMTEAQPRPQERGNGRIRPS